MEKDARFLAAWRSLAELGPQWWPEVGRCNGGSWYCELVLGAVEPHRVGPAIRVTAPTAAEAIEGAIRETEVVQVWPN